MATFALLLACGCEAQGERQVDEPRSSWAVGEGRGNDSAARPGDSGSDVDSARDSVPLDDSGGVDTGTPRDPTRARGEYPFPAVTYPLPTSPSAVDVLPDIDGDGTDEILVGMHRSDGLAVIRANLYDGSEPSGWVVSSHGQVRPRAWMGGFAAIDGDGAWFFTSLPAEGSSLSDSPAGPLVGAEWLDGGLDLTGDGVPDVLVNRDDDDVAYLFAGPLVSTPDWAAPHARLGVLGSFSLADVDLDGVGDVLWVDSGASEVVVSFGPVGAGTVDISSLVRTTLHVPWPHEWMQWGAVFVPGPRGEGGSVLVETSQGVAVFSSVSRGEDREAPDYVIDSEIQASPSVASLETGCDGDGNGVGGLVVRGTLGGDYAMVFGDLPGSGRALLEAEAVLTGEEAHCADLGAGVAADIVMFDHSDLGLFRGLQQPPGDDADRDGFATDVDCDDLDASLHPYATEIANGLDDDCSGGVDDRLGIGSSLGEVPGVEGELGARLGGSVSAFDADGDGILELVAVGATESGSSVYFLRPGDSLSLALATGLSTSEGKGVAGAGDTDGDGAVDLLAADDGVAWLLREPIAGEMRVKDQPTALRIELGEGELGALRSAGDVDGDGLDDIATGAAASPYMSEGSTTYYGVLLAGADLTESSTAPVARLELVLNGGGDYGSLPAGDVNGDGYADLFAVGNGEAHLLLGPVSGELPWDSYDAVLGLQVSDAAAVDRDADGNTELVVVEAGYAYLLLFDGIAAGGSYVRADAASRVTVPDHWGSSDLGLDAHPGLGVFLSVWQSSGGARLGGRVHQLGELPDGDWTVDALASAWWDGVGPFDQAGASILLADLHGDGVVSLAIGSPAYDGDDYARGRIDIVTP